MAVLTPMTSPFMLSSGPPELPGLMAASVWMKCWNWPGAPWSMVRFLAEMMPAVTVCAKANGLPMASTQSPTCAVSELPILTGQRRAGVDLDHGEVGGFIDADDASGTAQSCVSGSVESLT
jgi:hypothetical protein